MAFKKAHLAVYFLRSGLEEVEIWESDLHVLLHIHTVLLKRDIVGYHMLRSDGILGRSLKLRAPLVSKASFQPRHGGYKVVIFAIISGVKVGVEASGGIEVQLEVLVLAELLLTKARALYGLFLSLSKQKEWRESLGRELLSLAGLASVL